MILRRKRQRDGFGAFRKETGCHPASPQALLKCVLLRQRENFTCYFNYHPVLPGTQEPAARMPIQRTAEVRIAKLENTFLDLHWISHIFISVSFHSNNRNVRL
jgi:hypothetical protein